MVRRELGRDDGEADRRRLAEIEKEIERAAPRTTVITSESTGAGRKAKVRLWLRNYVHCHRNRVIA